MTDADRVKLLHGPYDLPRLRKGDRAFCLYRDAEAVITGWTDARIPWPRCRALHQRGGSGLLVTEELRRAILGESAAALKHWFGVGTRAVWNWRRAFGVGRCGTDGSRRLHRATVERATASTRGVPLSAGQVELRRQNARRLNLARHIQLCPRPGGSRPWTAQERAQLGTMPDDELAVKIGRPENVVRVQRAKLGIPTYRDRRLSQPSSRCGARHARTADSTPGRLR
jgi:hypothetical protein